MNNQLAQAALAGLTIGYEQKEKELQVAGAYDQYKPDKWESEYIDDIYKQYQERQNPKNPGEPEAIQMELPLDLVKQLMIKAEERPDLIAGFMDDLKIDPTAHKGAQKKTKIYNKATQGSGSEKDWLKKTGPQLPLASVPSSRTIRDHLKKGTKGLRPYDDAGGGRGIPEEEWLKLIRSVPTA